MKEEQIEKAARDLCTTNRQEQWLKDFGTSCFMDGARWRIDAAWHKPSAYGEELTRGVEVIAKTKRGYRFGKFDVVGYSNEYIAFVSTSSFEYALSDVLEYVICRICFPKERRPRNEQTTE